MTSASGLVETQVTIEDIFGEGDRVAVRWTFRGIYRGAPKPDYPQPQERCTIVAISTYRFVDGKIEGDWGVQAFWAGCTPWE
jgi:predicted ester cyclase